jgi:hypothetical protein
MTRTVIVDPVFPLGPCAPVRAPVRAMNCRAAAEVRAVIAVLAS